MKFSHSPKILALSFALIIALAWPRNAHAYLDPGTGSMLWQMLLAGLFGALFTIKMYWRKFKAFFSKLLAKKGEEKNE